MLQKSRFVGIILMILIAVSLFSGCMKETGKDGDSKNLTVLNYADMTGPNTAVTQGWTWGMFRSMNSDISIMIEDLFNEPFHNKAEAYAASGNMPDVLYVWPSGRSTSLHQNRLLKDLGPLIARDGLERVYNPIAMLPDQQASGFVAMIPLTITTTHVLYVNMEVLNAAGLEPAKTYAELKAQVPVLKAAGYETIIMPNMDAWVMQSCLFSMIAGRFGGQHWHEEILAENAKFTDPAFVNALEFIKQLYTDGVIARSSLATTYGDGPGLFANNACAYYIDGDWRVGQFITDLSTKRALIPPERQRNIRLTVFPDIENARINKTNSGVLGTGWAMDAAIPEGSQREEAAWRLIKWLTGREVQMRGIQDGAYRAAARTDIDTSHLNLEPIQITAGRFDSEYTSLTAVIDSVFHSDVYNVINDSLQEIGLGTKTPRQAAEEIQRAFDRGRAAGTW
ncbi:MAG: extracellular solute-binding protein [Treponema sp.]|nr:extracellular solute-binding protein [Treponema sp.]